jgi:hypothetical protein
MVRITCRSSMDRENARRRTPSMHHRQVSSLRLGLIALWYVMPVVCQAEAPAPVTESVVEVSHQKWKSCAEAMQQPGVAQGVKQGASIALPGNSDQMLTNLKTAWDNNLLLSPSFYEENSLRKFFAGSEVRWVSSLLPMRKDVAFVAADVASRVLPGSTVHVESRCWRTEQTGEHGIKKSMINEMGFIRISGSPIPAMTLRAVRSVFGPESENNIDSGIGPDDNVYTPVNKGSVAYVDRDRDRATGLALGVKFVFKLDSTSGVSVTPQKIVDDDIVQGIEVHEVQPPLLEK